MRAVTEEEFLEWRRHPVTLAVVAVLAAKREELRQQWEGGAFTDWTQEGMALTNVGNIGTCRGYAYVQELDYEQYLTEIDDGKSERVGPPRSGGPDQGVRTGTEGGPDSAA